jgi:hypothetical protein
VALQAQSLLFAINSKTPFMADRNKIKLCLIFFLSGSVATALLVMSIVAFLRYHERSQPTARSAGVQEGQHAVPRYGLVEALEIPLPYPEGVVPDENERLQPSKWSFPGFTAGRLVRLLGSCDLRPSQRRILLNPKYCNITSNGCVITPPATLIWSLNSRARQQIYSALGRSKSNYAQRFPLRFSPNGFEERLAESGLNDRELERIRRLAYTNSGTICFTDLETVRDVLTPEGFDDLIEALYEVPAFTLRLHVTPESDIDELVEYWGKGGREKLIRPLLRALTRVPGGASINVSVLMPPFPRLRLYTFPDSWDDPTASRQDCFFTALNFFNATADTNFFDSTYCQKTVEEQYAPVAGEPTYGDLIVLVDSGGKAIHTAVYIADDFVFTKNGVNRMQPWVFMRMSDMMSVYFAPCRSGNIMILRANSRA